MKTFIIIYAVSVSLIAFAFYGIDKRLAQHKCRRISEATLIFLAAVGGAVGALCGMFAFHHKTKKPLFFILVPLFSAVWIFLYVMSYLNL